MKTTQQLFCVLALSASVTATTTHADTLGLYLGGGIWQSTFKGEVGIDDQPATLDELGMDKKQNTYFFAALEHPVPVLPNIRVDMTNLSTTGAATITREIIIDNDTTIPADSDTTSKLDLSHVDFTLYWEVLDNYVSWDLGLTGRAFNGEAEITYTCPAEVTCDTPTDTASEEIKVTVPLLYTKLQIELPFSGWFIAGDIHYVGYDGNTISDIEAKFGYLTDGMGVDVGFDLGYRQMKMKVNDDEDFNADLTASGPFASLTVHF